MSLPFQHLQDQTLKNLLIILNDKICCLVAAVEAATEAELWTESGGNIYRETGNVGIGEDEPVTKLHILSTTTQLRLDYDADNNLTVNVGSTGNVSLETTGTDQSLLVVVDGEQAIKLNFPENNYQFGTSDENLQIVKDDHEIYIQADNLIELYANNDAMIDVNGVDSKVDIRGTSGINLYGNVGMGTNNPQAVLDVEDGASNIYLYIDPANNQSWVSSISGGNEEKIHLDAFNNITRLYSRSREVVALDGNNRLYTFGETSGNALISLDNAASMIALKGALKMSGTPQTLTGPGAVNLTTFSTLLVTTGADALTLAAGAEGQFKFIKMKTDGGDGTLTVTNGQGFTTITFNDAGDFVYLFYQDAKWHILTNSGCTVA